MSKELTIQELIAEQIEKNKKEEQEREEQKKIAIILKAQQDALKAQQKVIKNQEKAKAKEAIIVLRNSIFNNCCNIISECVGLEVSKKYEPQHSPKYNFSGKVKFKVKPLKVDNSHVRSVLHVGSMELIMLDVCYVSNKTVEISLLIFSDNQRYLYDNYQKYGDAYKTRYKPVYTKRILLNSQSAQKSENNIYSSIKSELVKYFSTIVTSLGTSKPVKIEKITIKVPNTDGFQFIDLNK